MKKKVLLFNKLNKLVLRKLVGVSQNNYYNGCMELEHSDLKFSFLSIIDISPYFLFIPNDFFIIKCSLGIIL